MNVFECRACEYDCSSGCATGYSVLFGLCLQTCPFGTTSSQSSCLLNEKPSLKFANILGNKVLGNSESVKIQLHLYTLATDFSVAWTLLEAGVDVRSQHSPLTSYLKNRQDYIVFP